MRHVKKVEERISSGFRKKERKKDSNKIPVVYLITGEEIVEELDLVSSSSVVSDSFCVRETFAKSSTRVTFSSILRVSDFYKEKTEGKEPERTISFSDRKLGRVQTFAFFFDLLSFSSDERRSLMVC
jgi:hypothetical protein